MEEAVNFSTNRRQTIKSENSLDFAFFIHPREARDILAAYPYLDGQSDDAIHEAFRRDHMHIISSIEASFDGKTLRGELIGVPLDPRNFRSQLHPVRESLLHAMNYCAERRTRIIGLGALLPSMTKYGRTLLEYSDDLGITTGHSYTAHVIAEYVRQIEARLGAVQDVAIVGAAGSTGRATLLALLDNSPARILTLVDLPERMRSLSEFAAREDHHIRVTHDLFEIHRSRIVVCVTNSTTAILRPEFLAPNCIVIDDAQPENISYETARKRPDVTVVKCLARVPDLKCPFDFRLFNKPPAPEKQEITFTCLAETVALAASGHEGHFTIGNPTIEHIKKIGELTAKLGITIAPFHSFPEVGEIHKFPGLNGHSIA